MDWVERWTDEGWTSEAAQTAFDRLPGVTIEHMIGAWRGSELPTGHPLDGLLALYGWWGKRFIDADVVDPLVFERGQTKWALNPTLLPVDLALALPKLVRTAAARALFRAVLPLLATHSPRARLRRVERGGELSAAMIYDDKPIIDHFRRVDDNRVLGLMDLRSTPAPYFFLLTRE